MYKLNQKLSPDDFIQTFFEVNRTDHQRPPHPWETLFREGKCTREQLQGWAKERFYFVKNVPTKEYSILYNCPIRRCAGCGSRKPLRKKAKT